MRPILVLLVLAALVLGAVLPIATIDGPFGHRIELSLVGIARDALARGDHPAASGGPQVPGLDELQRQLSGDLRSIALPLVGPALLVVSVLALALHYLLALPGLGWLLLRAGAWRLHLAAALCGVAFLVCFISGAHLTQEAINNLRADSLGGKLLALVSGTAGRLYAIKPGPGGWILGSAALAAVLATPFCRRKPPVAATAA